MAKQIFALLIGIFLLTSVAQANRFSAGKRHNQFSHILNENREVQVLLPESYDFDKSTSYPVIYLLDGEYNFHGVSGMLDLMANKGQLIPDVILVGISDKGTDKYRQYMTPNDFTAPRKSSDKGKANEFLNYLQSELKPFVETSYRTADTSILVGHSIGGLFVLNALVEQPNSFTHFVATSPSLWLDDHAFEKKARPVLAKAKHEPVELYLALGDETRMGQYRFIDILDDLQSKYINWQFKHYPDENHNSVGLVALRGALKSIFEGWYIAESRLNRLQDPESLLTHYSKLSKGLGLNQAMPTPSMRAAVRYFYRNEKVNELSPFLSQITHQLPSSEAGFVMMAASYAGHFESPEAALELMLRSAHNFKHSIEYTKALAGVYEKLKKPKQANEYYRRALKLAESQNANQWQLNIINAKISETRS